MSHNAACSEGEFRKVWAECRGSAVLVAKRLGVDERSVHSRRRRLERGGAPLLCESPKSPDSVLIGSENTFIRRNTLRVENGSVVIFTDAHIYPGVKTTARRGLIKLLPAIKPVAVIDNGDSVDGGRISRHDRIGWDRRPTMKEEIDENVEFHAEVESAAKGADFFWDWGNHDLRPQTWLAKNAPDFEGLQGFRLEDWFPRWKFGICVVINTESETPVLVKHRYRNGDHADWMNTMRAGVHTVTGHDHQMTCRPFVDMRGHRYGIRAGTLSDVGLPIFDYQEANPSQQRSGFVVLTFKDGKLLWPQFCAVWDENHVEYCSEVIPV